MKSMRKILTVLLALVVMLSLAACGEIPAETTAPTTAPTVQTTLPTAEKNPSYTVKVVDQSGNPIAGAMVQLCSESCIPALTNAEGIATYNVAEANYKVSFVSLPAGYDYTTTETEFYFDAGSMEMTITLKAAG